MKRIVCTIASGFALGFLLCFILNNMSYFQRETNIHSGQNSTFGDAIFVNNVQKNVSEDDGGFFIPSPHVEENIIEDEMQDV